MPAFFVSFLIWIAVKGRLQVYYDLAARPVTPTKENEDILAPLKR